MNFKSSCEFLFWNYYIKVFILWHDKKKYIQVYWTIKIYIITNSNSNCNNSNKQTLVIKIFIIEYINLYTIQFFQITNLNKNKH